MRDLRAGMTVFLMMAAAGCAASHTPAEATGPAPASRAESARDSTGLQVQIDNQNISDMDIYLLRSGSRWLVGQAGGLSKTTLTIPESMAPTDLRVRLLADPIGGSRPIVTPSLFVPPGQRVYWSIGSDAATSSVSAG
jgi:hypothetical protein